MSKVREDGLLSRRSQGDRSADARLSLGGGLLPGAPASQS